MRVIGLSDMSEPPSSGKTILMVEDNAEVRRMGRTLLVDAGFEVHTAGDAAEALARTRAGLEFDLLFTDIVMPGPMNGRQLAERMMAERPALRVLFTSGYAYGAMRAQGRAGRGIPMLMKPYRKAELARMLRRCLDPAFDAAGGPIPQPCSVQPELERFPHENQQ